MCRVLSAGQGGKEEGGDGRPRSRNICRAGGGRDCSLGVPGPALGARPVRRGPGAQGRDPSCRPPAAGTHALGVAAQAALQWLLWGTPSPLRFYTKRTPHRHARGCHSPTGSLRGTARCRPDSESLWLRPRLVRALLLPPRCCFSLTLAWPAAPPPSVSRFRTDPGSPSSFPSGHCPSLAPSLPGQGLGRERRLSSRGSRQLGAEMPGSKALSCPSPSPSPGVA